MDPTKTLEELRELTQGDTLDGLTDDIVERFAGLDDWISKGGFLPEQWASAAHRPGRPRRLEDGDVLQGVPHGKRRSYNLGCQCIPCTAANRLRRNLTPTEMQEYTS